MQNQLDALFDLIDTANRADPVQENHSGKTYPRALLYGQRMSNCLDRYCPDAPVELRVASRAQHICRWQSPRSDYPPGRSGYLSWRRDLARHHAQLTADLMSQLGLDKTYIDRVKSLLQKRNLKRDADTQILEDVACLVFLEYYFEELCRQHEDEKIISILAKTWRKMSARGHAAALELGFPPQQQRLINSALSPQ